MNLPPFATSCLRPAVNVSRDDRAANSAENVQIVPDHALVARETRDRSYILWHLLGDALDDSGTSGRFDCSKPCQMHTLSPVYRPMALLPYNGNTTSRNSVGNRVQDPAVLLGSEVRMLANSHRRGDFLARRAWRMLAALAFSIAEMGDVEIGNVGRLVEPGGHGKIYSDFARSFCACLPIFWSFMSHLFKLWKPLCDFAFSW